MVTACLFLRCQPAPVVYLRDLPAEVPVSFVKAAFSPYGTVHDVTAMEHTGFPGLLNGTRLVKVTLENDIPSTIHIRGFDCRVWYQGQPQACAVCRSYRHRVRECPLNGLCRRCHQPGHVARECREPRHRSSTVHHESVDLSSLSVLVGPSAEGDDDDPDVVFESADESEPASSISEREEALASGDELVIDEGSAAGLPPRSSVPVSSPPPVSSCDAATPIVPSEASKPPVAKSPVTVSSAVVTPIVSSKVTQSSVKPPVCKSSVMPNVPPKATESSVKPLVKSSPSSESSVESTRTSRKAFVPPPITKYARAFKDHESPCGISRVDFGHFTMDVIRDKVSFEYDRFVAYVHRGCVRPDLSDFGNADVCPRSKRLRSGEPQKFPGQ